MPCVVSTTCVEHKARSKTCNMQMFLCRHFFFRHFNNSVMMFSLVYALDCFPWVFDFPSYATSCCPGAPLSHAPSSTTLLWFAPGVFSLIRSSPFLVCLLAAPRSLHLLCVCLSSILCPAPRWLFVHVTPLLLVSSLHISVYCLLTWCWCVPVLAWIFSVCLWIQTLCALTAHCQHPIVFPTFLVFGPNLLQTME